MIGPLYFLLCSYLFSPLSPLHLSSISFSSFIHSLSASGNGKDNVISDLLSPPLETIASARTRVYMPVEAVISSVQLLSTLIQSIIKGHSIFNVNGKPLLIMKLIDVLFLVREGTGRLVYRALLPWLPEILSYFQDVLLNGLHLSSSSTIPSPPSPPPSSPLDVVQLFSDASHSLYQFISMSGWSVGDNDRSLSCPGLADRAADALLGIVKKNQVKHIINVSLVLLFCDA